MQFQTEKLDQFFISMQTMAALLLHVKMRLFASWRSLCILEQSEMSGMPSWHLCSYITWWHWLRDSPGNEAARKWLGSVEPGTHFSVLSQTVCLLACTQCNNASTILFKLQTLELSVSFKVTIFSASNCLTAIRRHFCSSVAVFSNRAGLISFINNRLGLSTRTGWLNFYLSTRYLSKQHLWGLFQIVNWNNFWIS